MCSDKMEVKVRVSDGDGADNRKVPPVSVTKFETFYLSLRDTKIERRNRCSDSLRRMRQYRGLAYAEKTTTQTIVTNYDDDDDDDVLFIGDFELQGGPSSHEVVQHAYGATKEVWAWGKTVPVLSNVLGLTEGVTSKILEVTIHVDDRYDIEKDLVIPNLKKFDDEILSPLIGTILNKVGPAVSVGEEVIVKHIMHIVPQIPFLGQFVLGEEKEDKANDDIDNRTDGSLATK